MKRLFTLLFLYSFSAQSFEIAFTESIQIKKSLNEVFDLAANASNDELWRTEVHSITTEGPFDVGTVYVEDAFLGFHYHYITKVKLVDLSPPHFAFYETTDDNPYGLKSYRTFKSINKNLTEFTYRVFIEEELVYDILFPGMPLSIAETGYRGLMRFYLKNLKRHLEH